MNPAQGPLPRGAVGAVVIGRNEGQRLRACLASLAGKAFALVYVDSGSSDGSVALARQMGAEVVELDPATPFTAARSRNAGWSRLCEISSDIELVQFFDGDCEAAPDWVDKAIHAILLDSRLAVVCGRRRERFPEASVYNRLCDIEWNTPLGDAEACGGDALMRMEALREVGGFNSELIAGEEPDLCLRLRQRGHRILRLDAEMCWHDANMQRFGQWWKRSVRSGYAYAEGFSRHRGGKEKYWAKQVRSNVLLGFVLPVLVVGLALPTHGRSVVLLGVYLAVAIRVFRASRRRGLSVSEARLYAIFCVLGKFPTGLGQLRYWAGRLLGRRSRIIEYKRAGE